MVRGEVTIKRRKVHYEYKRDKNRGKIQTLQGE